MLSQISLGPQNKPFFLLIGITALSVFFGKIVTTFHLPIPFIFLGSLVLLMLALLRPNLAMVCLIFFMLLSPELTIGKLPRRDIVIRIEDLMIITLSLFWFARISINNDLRAFIKTPINKYIIFYCIIFIIATARGIMATGVHPLKGVFYILKYLEYFIIYFLALNMTRNKRHIKAYLYAFLMTFLIVNIYGFFQIGHVGRVSAPFEGSAGEPNTLGGYQVLLTGIILGLFIHTYSKRWRIFLFSLLIIMIVPFLHTFSRSSYLAMVMMYLSLIIFSRKKKLVLTLALIISVVLSVFFMPQKVRDRVQYTFIPSATQSLEPLKILGVPIGPSASARVDSWIRVFERWKENPALGYGLTGLGFLDSQFIRTFAELGLIGLISFFLLIGSIFKNTLGIYKNSKDNVFQGLALGFLAGHIGILFHALTTNTFIIVRIMEPYWFLAAMVMVIPKIEAALTEKIAVQKQDSQYPRNATFLLES